MKILLGIATYPTEPHVYPAAQAAIDALEQDGHAVLVVYYGDDDPKKSHLENLLVKHNRMRDDALNLEYDALFTVEADMIIPPDTLTKLTPLDVDVAMGLYVSRSSRIWLCIPVIDGYKGNALNADPEAAKAAWGTVIKSEGAGFGCTLIHRNVLEAITFRNHPKGKFSDDWQFALDCKEKGFTMAHDLSVVCGHILHEGGVLWPDIDAPELHRVEGLGAQGAPAQHKGVTLPEQATYKVLKNISGSKEYVFGDTIVLSAEAAAILLERRAIENMES
jgi:hypothetical protein